MITREKAVTLRAALPDSWAMFPERHKDSLLAIYESGVEALDTIIAQSDEIARLTAELEAERAKVKAWEEAVKEQDNKRYVDSLDLKSVDYLKGYTDGNQNAIDRISLSAAELTKAQQ